MAVGRYGWASNGRGQMRAADKDRDRAVGFLTTAYTEGRLDKDEYDARIDQALHARTYNDLDMIVSDLPGARTVPVVAPRPTNSLAIASLACGVSQLLFLALPTIPAIVLGHMARSQIKRTGEDGAGMALGGLILGWIGLSMFTLIALALVAVASTRTGYAIHQIQVGPHHAPPPPAIPPAP